MKRACDDWQIVKLKDICAHITDGKHGDCKNEENSGFYFLSCKDVYDGKLNYTAARQITESDFYDTHRRTKFAPADIVITNSGTIGRMAIAPDTGLTLRTTFQKSVAILKPIVSRVEPRFLYYALHGDLCRLIEFAGGTAQKNLLLRDLRDFDIRVPPPLVQRRIADILSAYDNLIENNLRRIKILEDMARLLYREWFVEFRFPGHETVPLVDSPLGKIPEGWHVGKLDDVLVLQRGFDLPKNQRGAGSYPVFAATGEHGTHTVAKVKGPGVVTGRSGSLGKVLYIMTDFWPLNTTLWVKDFRIGGPEYAFFVLSTIDLTQYNSGAAVPTLNRNDIHGLATILPPDRITGRFHEIVEPMFRLKFALERKNASLRRTRDLLLPRLLSGQLDISTVKYEHEEIAA